METPPAKELLKKMIELEQSQKHLKQEMSRLKVSTELRHRQKESLILNLRTGVGGCRPSARKFTDKQYLNLLQSMAQSVHAFDLKMRIIFWNAMAEKLYGYTAEEAVGQNPINVMVDDRDAAFAMEIAQLCSNGETWTGKFPVKSRTGKKFSAVTTCSPFYADDGSLIGIVAITSDTAPYLNPRLSFVKLKAQEVERNSSPASNGFASKLGLDSKESVMSKLGIDSDQPIQVAIASKISVLASKVSNKFRSKIRESHSQHWDHGVFTATLAVYRDDTASTAISSPRGDVLQSPFGIFTCNDEKFASKPFKVSSGGKPAIHKVLTSKAEEWMVNKGLPWPWKGNEQEKEKSHHINHSSDVQSDSHAFESIKPINNEASGLRSSSRNANRRNSASSFGSTCSSVINKIVTDSNCLDTESLWEDLTIGEKIGQGQLNKTKADLFLC